MLVPLDEEGFPVTTTNPHTAREDRYVEAMLAKAAEGDPATVIGELARSVALNVRMGGELIRSMQAAYAAGVLHGPEQAMEWLGNTLAGAGNCPRSDSPDPLWFAHEGPGSIVGPRPVPVNCATANQRGTAAPTHPRPGITGVTQLEVLEHDGAQWETTRQWLLRVNEPDPGAWPHPEPETVFAGLAQRITGGPVAVKPWVPPGVSRAVDTVVHCADTIDAARLLVLERQDGQYAYVNPLYWLAVTANIPAGWDAHQMGGPNAPIRFIVPGLADPGTGPVVWGWLMPVKAQP
jgi:hypothetical protein